MSIPQSQRPGINYPEIDRVLIEFSNGKRFEAIGDDATRIHDHLATWEPIVFMGKIKE